jgi:hypothetical protein
MVSFVVNAMPLLFRVVMMTSAESLVMLFVMMMVVTEPSE